MNSSQLTNLLDSVVSNINLDYDICLVYHACKFMFKQEFTYNAWLENTLAEEASYFKKESIFSSFETKQLSNEEIAHLVNLISGILNVLKEPSNILSLKTKAKISYFYYIYYTNLLYLSSTVTKDETHIDKLRSIYLRDKMVKRSDKTIYYLILLMNRIQFEIVQHEDLNNPFYSYYFQCYHIKASEKAFSTTVYSLFSSDKKKCIPLDSLIDELQREMSMFDSQTLSVYGFLYKVLWNYYSLILNYFKLIYKTPYYTTCLPDEIVDKYLSGIKDIKANFQFIDHLKCSANELLMDMIEFLDKMTSETFNSNIQLVAVFRYIETHLRLILYKLECRGNATGTMILDQLCKSNFPQKIFGFKVCFELVNLAQDYKNYSKMKEYLHIPLSFILNLDIINNLNYIPILQDQQLLSEVIGYYFTLMHCIIIKEDVQPFKYVDSVSISSLFIEELFKSLKFYLIDTKKINGKDNSDDYSSFTSIETRTKEGLHKWYYYSIQERNEKIVSEMFTRLTTIILLLGYRLLKIKESKSCLLLKAQRKFKIMFCIYSSYLLPKDVYASFQSTISSNLINEIFEYDWYNSQTSRDSIIINELDNLVLNENKKTTADSIFFNLYTEISSDGLIEISKSKLIVINSVIFDLLSVYKKLFNAQKVGSRDLDFLVVYLKNLKVHHSIQSGNSKKILDSEYNDNCYERDISYFDYIMENRYFYGIFTKVFLFINNELFRSNRLKEVESFIEDFDKIFLNDLSSLLVITKLKADCQFFMRKFEEASKSYLSLLSMIDKSDNTNLDTLIIKVVKNIDYTDINVEHVVELNCLIKLQLAICKLKLNQGQAGKELIKSCEINLSSIPESKDRTIYCKCKKLLYKLKNIISDFK